MTEEMKAQLRETACGGQPCAEDMPQRHFFSALYKQNNPDVTQRLDGRGCTQQCVQRGFTFYCCPPLPAENGAMTEEDMLFEETMLDDPSMDYGMEPSMEPVDNGTLVEEKIIVVEEEKKPPWLLIGVGVLGVGVIGYLLATRK